MISASAVALLLSLAQGTDAQRARVAWVPNPRVANGTWVADPSHRLSPAAVATINGEISALEAATGAEIAVVVVDSTSGLDPFDFALAIHRVWGVGKRGANNGVVLLWVPAQRAVWISVGQGLEGAIPDRRAGRIRDEEIFPAFRRGEFDAGMIAGVRALAAAARGEGPAASATRTGRERDADGGGAGIVATIAGLVVTLIVGTAGYRRWRRRRPRPCPNGHGMMRRLDETADDEKLEGGERLEESYKSVDWDVWLCDTCGHSEKIPYRRWTSSYSDCPEYRRRTLKTSERTITRATTLSTGRKIVTRTCGNCGFKDSREVVIPRVSTASSSSAGGGSGGGGGGGSFGGGSAGGGGAGGRY